MAVLLLTKCRPGGKLIKMKPWSKRKQLWLLNLSLNSTIYNFTANNGVNLETSATTSSQFALLSFEKFIEYKTCWSGIRSLQTTAAGVSRGVYSYCNSPVILPLLGFIYPEIRLKIASLMGSVGRDREWCVPGKFLCCLLYQMLTWNVVLMPRDISLWFYSFRIDVLLSHHLIENKIFILTDRYKKLFVCVSSWQLCNFQAGHSLLPCYFFQCQCHTLGFTKVTLTPYYSPLVQPPPVQRGNPARGALHYCSDKSFFLFSFESSYLDRNQELIFLYKWFITPARGREPCWWLIILIYWVFARILRCLMCLVIIRR